MWGGGGNHNFDLGAPGGGKRGRSDVSHLRGHPAACEGAGGRGGVSPKKKRHIKVKNYLNGRGERIGDRRVRGKKKRPGEKEDKI